MSVQALEEERDELRREVNGLQEMLGFVLLSVGHPVMVTKEALENGTPPGAQIQIDEDMQSNAFIFSIKVQEETSE